MNKVAARCLTWARRQTTVTFREMWGTSRTQPQTPTPALAVVYLCATSNPSSVLSAQLQQVIRPLKSECGLSPVPSHEKVTCRQTAMARSMAQWCTDRPMGGGEVLRAWLLQQPTWLQSPVPYFLINCEALGRCFNPSVPQFSDL